jgi:hypothetical protein
MNSKFVSSADQALLDAVPGYLSITQMLKATPATEGGERFIYIEASSEGVDQQNEVILAKALGSSSDYYLKFGNLDIDHYTQIGAKSGIPNHELYEIGRPVSVTQRDGRTFVKGQIYSGTGPAAEKANAFWSSITEINPPARWYPSVGGSVMAKSVAVDPDTGNKHVVINSVRWTNIGFSKTPVNANLATVSAVPFGALAKSFHSGGFDLAKALEAGYGTDSASLEGGAALRKQSIQKGVLSYWDMRDDLSRRIKSGQFKTISPTALVEAAQNIYGLPPDRAAAMVGRFLGDLDNNLKRKKT